jgi:trimeric autotransporter adhesin
MDFGFARGGTAPAASRGSISKREAASRLGLQSRGTTGVQVSLVFDLGTSAAAAAGRNGAAADKRKQQHPQPAQKQGRVRAAGFWRGSDAPPTPSVRAKDQPRSTTTQSSQRGKTLSSQRATGQRRQSASSTRRSSDAHDMAHYEFDAAGSDGDSNNSDDDGQSLMTQEHRSALQNRRLGKSVSSRSSAAAAGRYSVSSSPVLLSSASESGLNSSASCMRSPSHGHDTGLALPQQQSRAKGGIVDIMADLPTERERDVSSASVIDDNDDADSSAAAAAAVPVPAAAAQYNNNSNSSSVWIAMKTSLLSSLGQAQHHHTSSSSKSNGDTVVSSSVTRPPLVPAVQEPEPALLLSARGRAVAALGGSEHAATSSRNGLDLQQLDYERSTMDRTGRLGRVASARLLRTADASTAAAAAAAGDYSAGVRGKLCTAAPRHKSAGVTRRPSDVVLTLHGTRAELVPRDTPCDSSSTAGGSNTYGSGTGTISSATASAATASAAASASAALQRRRSAMGSRGGTAGSELFSTATSTAASTAYDGPPVAAAALTWMTDAEGMANLSRRPPSRQREAFPTHLASEAPFSIISSSSGSTHQQQQQQQQQQRQQQAQQQQQQQQPRRDAFLSAAAASAELHASQSQQRQQQQAAFAHAAVTIGTAAALSVRDSAGAAAHSTRAHLFDAATARKSSATASGTDAAGRPRARHKPPEQSLFLETPAELPLALAAAAAAKSSAAAGKAVAAVDNTGSSSNTSSKSSSSNGSSGSAKPLSVVTSSVVPPLPLTAVGASPHHLALLVEDDMAVTAVSPAASRTTASAAAAAASALMTPSHDFSLDTRHDDPARDGFDLLEVSSALCMRARLSTAAVILRVMHLPACCCYQCFTAKSDLLAQIRAELLLIDVHSANGCWLYCKHVHCH